MTVIQWSLAAVAAVIVLAAAALLGYTVYAMLTGRPTVSGYMKTAPRWVVAAVGLGAGLVIGVLFSHWWFPTVGVGSGPMISLSGAVMIVLYLVVGALVFGLLWWLVTFIGSKIPGQPGQLFVTAGLIVLAVLAVLVLIGLLLSLTGGTPLFRP